jgi:carboxymethylenebutenolidase
MLAATGYENLKIGDGTTMKAYVAFPQNGGKNKAIVVLQEIFGVNSHIRNIANRFANEGYVAIAPELFHRTAPGFEISYESFEKAMPHAQALTEENFKADFAACLEWLKEKTQNAPMACVGFCMGGRLAFLANSLFHFNAAVSFYGGGIAPTCLENAKTLHAPILFFWGEKDKHIPRDQRLQVLNALLASNKPFVNIEFSEADHGFFCDERQSYHPNSARLAWKTTLEFLEIHLQKGTETEKIH